MSQLDLFGPAQCRTASFSANGSERYSLGRWWANGPVLVWCMLNPSTADAEEDDPTVRRVVGFSKRWGAGSCRVVNVFSTRAPNPAALPVFEVDECVEATSSTSWASFPAYVKAAVCNQGILTMEVHSGDALVLAWGAGMKRHGQAWVNRTWNALLRGLPNEIYCLGRTKEGYPRHPLYVKGDTLLEPITDVQG